MLMEQVTEELDCAREYIDIAVFQIHDGEIFAEFSEKLREGIRVELFTLPYDSIHDGVPGY
jgi:hypothetical protein